MNDTRVTSESFGASMDETIARVQATRRAGANRRSQLYMATVLIAGIIVVGVILTMAAL